MGTRENESTVLSSQPIVSRIEFSLEEIEEIHASIRPILESGWLNLGSYTKAFENEWCTFFGVTNAVAVSTGTAALEILFEYLDVEGKEVIVPSNTNFATPAAALRAGATVRLTDGGLYPSVDDIEDKISNQTAAIVVVHIGGYISPYIESIRRLCDSKNIHLIEDAAHAHGARFNGRFAGSFGHAAAYSFFASKVITTCEGGIIATEDDSAAEYARVFRNQGKQVGADVHTILGNSYRMSEIEAAMGLAQLRYFDSHLAQRRKIMEHYRTRLGTLSHFLHVSEISGQELSGYKYICELNSSIDRNRVKNALRRLKGIELAREVYEFPIHRQPIFKDLTSGNSFPLADRFADQHICMPMWRSMSIDDADNIVDSLEHVLSEII